MFLLVAQVGFKTLACAERIAVVQRARKCVPLDYVMIACRRPSAPHAHCRFKSIPGYNQKHLCAFLLWLRRSDLNRRPRGYEPREITIFSTAHAEGPRGSPANRVALLLAV